MALSVWTESSGYEFATIQERTVVNQRLPVILDVTGITFKVISGKLPPGLRISDEYITGNAFEVPRDTQFKFVVRATDGTHISDRTFFLTVSGADTPTWVTDAGSLPIGSNNQYYILDSSYVDFQLQVTDFDTAAGQELKFFMPRNGGQLPPGLVLMPNGRIVGWVQPLLAVPTTEGNGGYDSGLFDNVAYDYGYRPTNGYDSYVFDSIGYDNSVSSLVPRKLNRYFEFVVTVTDGDSSVDRRFKIFVVGDDYFRSDTVAIPAGTGAYTADVTYVRAPIWVTPSNLGTRRANNYQTLRLDTYDAIALGQIVYHLEKVNPVITGIASTNAANENKVGYDKIRFKKATGQPVVGHKICLSTYVKGSGAKVYTVTAVTPISSTEFVVELDDPLESNIPTDTFIAFGTDSLLPPALEFDEGTAEVVGIVPYQSAITKNYSFTVAATRYSDKGETATSRRTFNISIIGEIESTMQWVTPSHLGDIDANLISTLSIKATSTIPNAVLLYQLKSGSLPAGLTLNLDGEIVGKVRQFENSDGNGLITFDENDFTLDFGTTTVDRSYTFEVEAKDSLGYSAITNTFTLDINTPNNLLYSNVFVKPYLKPTQRELFKSFITDATVFDISAIYRPNDPSFGIQSDLKMLVFAGIETQTAAKFASVMGRNHKKKRFKFGGVKKAVAKDFAGDVIYEVIYVEVIDPLEIGNKALPSVIETSRHPRKITVDQTNDYYNGPFTLDTTYWGPNDPLRATVDRNDVFAVDSESKYKFPSSITHWRKRIRELGVRERNYLPLWMRSVQPGQVQEIGYTKCIPLCFCKPGKADAILLNILNRNFDFSQIDYVIDRYIVDSVTGQGTDKYIAFRDDRTTIA